MGRTIQVAETARPGRPAEVTDRVGQLERRVAALEQAAVEQAALEQATLEQATLEQTAAGRPPGDAAGADDPAAPRTPVGDPPDDPGAGQISYSGDVTLHGHVRWSIGLAARSVLELPNTRGAAVLAGLGHPTRAALIRRLLAGPATTTQLLQVIEGSSTGQLYHHLRTLTSSGLAEQDGRGQYRVPPAVVVPALLLLTAAADVAGDLR